MKIEMTREQATAVHYALLLHTKDDSVSFPSNRVKLIVLQQAQRYPPKWQFLKLREK